MLRVRGAEALEEGRLRGAFADVLSRAWGHACARAVVRRLVVPSGKQVVAVGGATLGGSGKTPLAIACARELGRLGARVAFVGHAYRAHPKRARVVAIEDPIGAVGDEALLAARALGPARIPVVVGPSRASAVELAARHADVLVLDGVHQIAPRRAALALLAVDADEPWGRAGRVPPCGDLRAPTAALLAVADAVVSIGPAAEAKPTSRGAWLDGRLLPWDELRARRLGLVCALARPARILRTLELNDIRPVALLRAADHGPVATPALDALGAARAVDLWLASPKCALHAAPTRVPLATIDHDLVIGESLSAKLLSTIAP